MANYTSGGGFYDPQNDYGWGRPGQFIDTTLGGWLANEELPEGYFTRWLSEQGFGGNDNKSQQARSTYGRAQQGYNAALTKNYELKWTDYLDTLNMNEMQANMSPEERGASQGAGRMRWGMR